jgi:putative Ca2+/H+ antiporter (TMEM165/GDT1 family)
VKLNSAPFASLKNASQTTAEVELERVLDRNTSMTATAPPSSVDGNNSQKQSVVAIFATTFFTVFLAEIGDKTQLSILLMSAQSHSPWVVFLGSGAALLATSLLGVVVGSWIAKRLSPQTVNKAAGIMLLLISVMLIWDVIQ